MAQNGNNGGGSNRSPISSRFRGFRTVVVDLETDGPPLDVPHTEVVEVTGGRQWLRFDRRETSASQVVTEIVARTNIRDVAIEEPEIEDMVRNLYQGRS